MSEEENGITRRDFLKLAGAAAATVALTTVKGSTPERKEVAPNLGKHVVIVDTYNGRPEHFTQAPTEFPSFSQIGKKWLGEDFIDPRIIKAKLVLRYGLKNLKDNRKDTLIMAARDHPQEAKSIYFMAIMSSHNRHGEDVARAMQKAAASWEQALFPYIEPSQGLLEKVAITKDELDNPTVLLEVSPEKVIDALKKHPDQTVVNLSFQFGQVGFRIVIKEKTIKIKETSSIITIDHETGETQHYPKEAIKYVYDPENKQVVVIDEKGEPVEPIKEEDLVEKGIREVNQPYIHFFGAYSGERSVASLRKMFSVCNEFPNKAFIAAIGNEFEDIRKERDELAEEWPKNLLFVGTWEETLKRPAYEAHGADIYVKNKGDFGITAASSYSTPIISAAAVALKEANPKLTAPEIVDQLKSMSDETTYQRYVGAEFVKARVFSPNKLKEKIEVDKP